MRGKAIIVNLGTFSIGPQGLGRSAEVVEKGRSARSSRSAEEAAHRAKGHSHIVGEARQ